MNTLAIHNSSWYTNSNSILTKDLGLLLIIYARISMVPGNPGEKSARSLPRCAKLGGIMEQGYKGRVTVSLFHGWNEQIFFFTHFVLDLIAWVVWITTIYFSSFKIAHDDLNFISWSWRFSVFMYISINNDPPLILENNFLLMFNVHTSNFFYNPHPPGNSNIFYRISENINVFLL